MRTFVNKPGVTFDPLKTSVIFAEDINEIVEFLNNIDANGASVTVGTVEPTGASEGDLWLDTSVPVYDLECLYSSNHIQFITGVTNSEIYVHKLPITEKIHFTEMQVNKRGGGAIDTNFSIQIYDVTNSAVLATCTLNDVETLNVDTDYGITVAIRVTNGTGSDVDANYFIKGGIVYAS